MGEKSSESAILPLSQRGMGRGWGPFDSKA